MQKLLLNRRLFEERNPDTVRRIDELEKATQNFHLPAGSGEGSPEEADDFDIYEAQCVGFSTELQELRVSTELVCKNRQDSSVFNFTSRPFA